MGTPGFAVKIIDEIRKKHNVVLVVTQPDVYNIKKKKFDYSEVKKYALENELPLFQPEKIRNDYQSILDLDVDLIVTAAYGQIIPKVLLEYPKYKCINVHGSLLPKHRGGAPIQRAIINGDKETGVTIMYMAERMDAGDMLMQRSIPILDSDTQDTMFEKLSLLGAEMINGLIDDLVNGKVNPIKQNEEEVTFSYNLTKEDELITFDKDAVSVFNQIRGLNSNPGGYFIMDNQNVKVYASKVSDKVYELSNFETGMIVGINKDSFDVLCANNTVISITEIKMPSKNKMSVRDFLNGQGKKLITIGKKLN